MSISDKLLKGDKILLEGIATVENDMGNRVYFKWDSNGCVGWVYRENISTAYKWVQVDEENIIINKS